LSKFRVIAVCAIVVMLVVCLIEIGQMLVTLMRNESEMKQAREAYTALTGGQPQQGMSRVDLLPPGVTFAPAQSTPAPLSNTSGANAWAVNPSASQTASGNSGGSSAGDPSRNQRTKVSEYTGNPFGTVREPFVTLRKENPDIIGRLSINGILDELVVQRDNLHYLTRNAFGEKDAAGAVFADESCPIDSPPENLLLRGRSSESGRLFAGLLNYVSGGAEFVRRNALLRMDTLYEEGEYVIFAVILASSIRDTPEYFNYAGSPSFQSDWHMGTYVGGARQHSLYQIPVDVQPSDRLLTIATLGNGAEKESLVIVARKLRPGETAQSLSSALGAIK
jgi:hypothetical protein